MNRIVNANEILKDFKDPRHAYRNPRGFVYTEGIEFLSEYFQCTWLLKLIYDLSGELAGLQEQQFLKWIFRVDPRDRKTFQLICRDKQDMELSRWTIEGRRFKADEVTVLLIEGVILLPSEY